MDTRGIIINSFQTKLTELEEKINLLGRVEEQNRILQNEKFELTEKINEIELNFRIFQEKTAKEVSELQNDKEELLTELNQKKITNKKLFTEISNIKKDNYNLQKQIEILVQQCEHLEIKVNNELQIENNLQNDINIIKKENKKLEQLTKNLIEQIKILHKNKYSTQDICYYCLNDKNKFNSEINKKSINDYFLNSEKVNKYMKINQNLLKENTELKHHILILTDQNKNIISELENIKNEKYSVLVATNKKILENSLIKIELFLNQNKI